MKVVRSAWVAPVDSPPIRDGAVAIESGEIAGVGPAHEVLARWGDAAGSAAERARGDDAAVFKHHHGITDLGAAVLLPGLVNAHTHLELSWMHHAPPPRGDFSAWVRAMVARQTPPEADVASGIARSLAALASSGIVAVGDVGNTTAALPALRASALEGRFFLEIIGWERRGESRFLEAVRALNVLSERDGLTAATPTRTSGTEASNTAFWPAALVPHGPHSVSPEILERIAERARERGDVVSVHLAESREEDQLLRRGDGSGRTLLDEIGALPAGWEHPRLSPAQVLDRAGLLGPRTLAVHGVHLTREDARLLAARGTTVVLCPRSNAWLGVGDAPVAMLFEEGVRIALGTDSLASNDDLDLLAELRALRALAPAAPPEALLRAATLGGAEALGLSDRLGSITPGKCAALTALPLVEPTSGETVASMRADEEPYRTIFTAPRGSYTLSVPSS